MILQVNSNHKSFCFSIWLQSFPADLSRLLIFLCIIPLLLIQIANFVPIDSSTALDSVMTITFGGQVVLSIHKIFVSY